MRAHALRPWLAVLACLGAGHAPAAEAPVQVDVDEVLSHLIGPPPVIHMPWVDLTKSRGGGGWFFRITVAEDGSVATAVLDQGTPSRRQRALQLARAMKFKPFERDGRAVPATFTFRINGEALDYTGPGDRAFPPVVDPKQVSIALQRTGCLGSCPSYRVEVRGDGWVTYRGESDVLVEGEHRWRVAPEAVAALLERFRQAGYFKLQGRYAVNAYDLPSTTTRLAIGPQKKFVYDYGGGGVGNTLASTSFGGDPPQMPLAVTELEDAIDAVAGTASWITGDDNSVAMLRKAGWNFRSRAAAHGLSLLVRECRTALATQFIQAGAPVNVANQGVFEASLPMADAAHCGDVGLVRLMADKGALARSADAWAFLEAAAESGYPAFVEIALKHAPPFKGASREHRWVLFQVAEGRGPGNGAVHGAAFDPGRVVELLVAAGADPNLRRRDGDTPLHVASSGAVARALIRGGADVNARGQWGWTPLFNKYWPEPKLALIEAGADLGARTPQGDTALHYQHYPEVTKVLIQAGLDVNARDNDGGTPVETATEEEIALMLLAAGARLPTDPARRSALAAKATEKQWTKLLQALEAGAP